MSTNKSAFGTAAIAVSALIYQVAAAETLDFRWDPFSGSEIRVMLNQHPYAEAILERLPEFEERTGISVKYSVTPESHYFERLTAELNSHNNSEIDVYMTGSYQLWEFATAGQAEALDGYLEDASRTHPDYDAEDFFDGVIDGDRWNLSPGSPVGTGPLWAVPLAFEANVLMYNKRALLEHNLEVPTNYQELLEAAILLQDWNGEGSYGIATRGSRSWATIHPGYMSMYSNSGATDFKVINDRLVSQISSPGAVDVTKKYVELVKRGGPDNWSNYTWYQVAKDLGAGRAAMAIDADVIGFFQNVEGGSSESGNIGWATIPKVNSSDENGANLWIWSVAMNSNSRYKNAAWMFMQFFTNKEHMAWGATQANLVNPARKSVWRDPAFRSRMSHQLGYEETFNTIIEETSIKFTPQPKFFSTTTQWASALREMVTSDVDVKERMQQLANHMDRLVYNIQASKSGIHDNTAGD